MVLLNYIVFLSSIICSISFVVENKIIIKLDVNLDFNSNGRKE